MKGPESVGATAATSPPTESKHFGVECPSCKRLIAFPVSNEAADAAMQDPAEGLLRLAKEEQRKVAEFYVEHTELGHEPFPFIAEIAPQSTVGEAAKPMGCASSVAGESTQLEPKRENTE